MAYAQGLQTFAWEILIKITEQHTDKAACPPQYHKPGKN